MRCSLRKPPYLQDQFSGLTAFIDNFSFIADREQRELYEAAKIIQKAYRSYKGRKIAEEQEKERAAAILIQNYYRRYKQVSQALIAITHHGSGIQFYQKKLFLTEIILSSTVCVLQTNDPCCNSYTKWFPLLPRAQALQEK